VDDESCEGDGLSCTFFMDVDDLAWHGDIQLDQGEDNMLVTGDAEVIYDRLARFGVRYLAMWLLC